MFKLCRDCKGEGFHGVILCNTCLGDGAVEVSNNDALIGDPNPIAADYEHEFERERHNIFVDSWSFVIVCAMLACVGAYMLYLH